MLSIKNHYRLLLTLLLGVCAWVFWSFFYYSGLVYQEEVQMFLFTSDYFTERAVVPGGIARYVAEFLVQFYNNFLFGGLVVAVLYMLIQRLTWRAIRLERKTDSLSYLLSFVPVLALWSYMGYQNVRLTFVVAVVFALFVMACYPLKARFGIRCVYAVLALPLLYYLAGPVVMMAGLYFSLVEGIKFKNWLWALVAIVYAIACIVVSIPLTIEPVNRLFYGIGYNLLIEEFPMGEYVVMLLFAVVPICICLFPHIEDAKKQKRVFCGSFAVIAVAFIALIPVSFDRSIYEILDYDVLVRGQKWDKIIAKAEARQPQSPLSVSALNLALGMKGQMGERAGQFYQNGIAGAFPPFVKNFLASLMTSEVYYHVGLVNEGQCLAFEAMQTIPDDQKSSRIIKRLAETNLINGQYEVARKYLQLLDKTLFYRNWARSRMALLGNENAINHHPEYGYMRQVQPTEDFLFSYEEIDKIMGQLVMRNKNNGLAIQYLLLLPRLEGNRQKYLQYKDYVMRRLNEE